jgi:hypothetical protein
MNAESFARVAEFISRKAKPAGTSSGSFRSPFPFSCLLERAGTACAVLCAGFLIASPRAPPIAPP